MVIFDFIESLYAVTISLCGLHLYKVSSCVCEFFVFVNLDREDDCGNPSGSTLGKISIACCDHAPPGWWQVHKE